MIVIPIVAVALMAAGLITGVVQPVYEGDTTYITYAATVVAMIGTFWPTMRNWIVEHGLTLMLGFLGTVWGFWGALEGLATDDDIAKVDGVATALTTTIVGLIAHLYLLVMQKTAE